MIPTKSLNFKTERFQAQLAVVLGMQNSMNRMVFDDWQERGLAWHRAIYVEAGELLEHLGTWKWWKKGHPDVGQAQMELVDIWHFGLSWYIQRFGQPVDSEALVRAITRRVSQAATLVAKKDLAIVSHEDRHAQIDLLVEKAGARLFDTQAFVHLMAYLGMDFDDLFAQYVGKNVLNRFRQAHGYKQGTYQKIWNGEEDNVVLERLLKESTVTDLSALPDALYASLEQRYSQLTA